MSLRREDLVEDGKDTILDEEEELRFMMNKREKQRFIHVLKYRLNEVSIITKVLRIFQLKI